MADLTVTDLLGRPTTTVRSTGPLTPNDLLGIPSRPSPIRDLGNELETSLSQPVDEKPRLLHRIAPTAIRVVPAIAGGLIGSVVPGVGTALGAAAGGALGSAIGEFGAEVYEQQTDQRDSINPTQIGVQALLGAIPMGKTLSVASGAAKGAILGGGSALATQQAEEGLHVPTADDLTGITASALLGGATGGVLGKFGLKVQPRQEISADTPTLVRQAAAHEAGEFGGEPKRVFATKPGEELYNRDIPEAGRIHDDRTININMDQFGGETSPLAQGVRSILEENDGFKMQRRDVQSWNRASALADRIKVDVQTLKPGSTLNDAEFMAYGNAMATILEKKESLAARINQTLAEGKEPDIAEKLMFLTAKEDAASLMASYVGAAAEAGRALNIQKALKSALESHDVQIMRKALAAPGVDVEKMAQEFAQLPDDPLAKYKWLQSKQQTTWFDASRQYFYANILSGIKTHERNIIGNAMNSLFNIASHPFAVAGDVARSKVTGSERTIFMGELPKKVVGAAIGIPRAMQDFVFALRNGFSLDALGSFDNPVKKELAGGGMNPFNWPGRALEAADGFFASIVKHQELYALAYAQAKKEAGKMTTGQRSSFIPDRIAELVSDKSHSNPLWRDASKSAERVLFREDPGKLAHIVMLLKKEVPAIDFVLPFVKVPANIMKQGFQSTPLGFATAAKQEGRMAAETAGRAALGSAMLFPLAWYAAQGKISGSGPADPAERAALMEAGWRPNSIKIGDEWVSYQTLQPIAAPLALLANGFDAWRDNGEKPEDASKIAVNTVMRTANSVLDQSFLSGMSSLIEALNDPDRFGPAFMKNFVQGFVPMSGMQRNIAQAVDPVVRKPGTIGESIAANIPGMSQNVEPRIDRFGEDVTRHGNAFMRGMSAVEVSPVNHDPVSEELSRLGIKLTLPSADDIKDRGKTYALTPEQNLALRREKGQAVREALERLITNPAYANLSEELKYTMLQSAITRSRTQVTNRTRVKMRAAGISTARPQ